MNLSLRHMRAFAALASTRNFTRAAELCSLTQSAFSMLISNLENDLGVRLFSRNTRNVELTVEGEVFESLVGRLLPELDRALAEMQDHVQRRKGRVAIAALPSISSAILPKLIARFQKTYPGIDVVVQDVPNSVCVDLVRSRHVDFALGAAVAASADLDVEALASDTFHFICPRHHPLARRKALAADDVLDQPIIIFEPSSSIRQHLDASIYPKHWTRSHVVNNLSTAAGLIREGLGVTIAPTLALSQFGGLRAIPVTLPINRRDICLLRRRDGTDSVAAQAFIELLRESLEGEVRRLGEGHDAA